MIYDTEMPPYDWWKDVQYALHKFHLANDSLFDDTQATAETPLIHVDLMEDDYPFLKVAVVCRMYSEVQPHDE